MGVISSEDANGGGGEGGWMVCIFSSLLALFLIIATQISHLIPSISFLFTKLLQKAFDGWGAANSEGWDIESCEYDVSWMDGVEDLANEVRICDFSL